MNTTAPDLPTKSPTQVIEDIQAKLNEKPRKPGAAYTMIVGAGFSYGVVPLTKELLRERIGDFYHPRDKTTEVERSPQEARKLSRDYWKAFNSAGSLAGEPLVELDGKGLPVNPSLAYQELFTYRTANALLAQGAEPIDNCLSEPEPKPRVLAGKKFVRDFLQEVLDPGGYESRGEGPGASRDYCTTGRTDINAAHFFLASLLELQQSGELGRLRPFCRTIFTTNFDPLLQDALQLVNVLYSLSDRPEHGLEPSAFPEVDRAMHLVYTHGTILRHNAASTIEQLTELSEINTNPLKGYLESRDVLVFGYGGWDDSLMSALSLCDKTQHRVYWCNVYSADEAKTDLAPAVLHLLETSIGQAVYVPLGSEGADGFMARLYQALAPGGGVPSLLQDPIEVFVQRLRRVRLDNLVLTLPNGQPTLPGVLPLPMLEAAAVRVHGSACIALDAARYYFYNPKEKKVAELTSMQSEGQAGAMVQRGFALALAGKEDEAVQVWSSVLELTGQPCESALAANYLGIVHAHAGRKDLAISAFTRAFDLGSSSPGLQVEALTNRGTLHHRESQMDLAIEDFSMAIKIWENHPPAVSKPQIARALIYRGLTHDLKGDASVAQEDLNRAQSLKEVPPECRALVDLAGYESTLE